MKKKIGSKVIFALGLVALITGLTTRKTWALPAKGEKFAQYFAESEARYSLPKNILARMAQQESGFREDVITGSLEGGAGELGIMQIMPRYHPGVDPLNVPEAIDYAGQYLKSLYKQFGNYPQAIAAYNWGPGNLSKIKADPNWLDRLPAVTKKYVLEVASDINLRV